MSKKSLREQMPVVTALIDQMRDIFGKDAIDMAIRNGMRGEPEFWASESGIEIGTRQSPETPFESYFENKSGETGK